MVHLIALYEYTDAWSLANRFFEDLVHLHGLHLTITVSNHKIAGSNFIVMGITVYANIQPSKSVLSSPLECVCVGWL